MDSLLAVFLSSKLSTLFVVITLGLMLGRLRLFGLSLGSSGVIFVALAAGHFGLAIPEDIGSLGLVLFVYCVGISAGPTFFRVFVRQGKTLAKLSVALVAFGIITTWVMARVSTIPADLAVGIFAGAMTSTPALAAATESLPTDSQAAVGFGIAYPFGIIGVVLFAQLLPRLLRRDFDQLNKQLESQTDTGQAIVRALITVMNPAMAGKKLSEVELIGGQVSRVLRGEQLVPVAPDFMLELGQDVLVVGRESQMQWMIDLLGKRSETTRYLMDTEHHRMQVVATSKNVVAQKLVDLGLLRNFGITVSRVTRHDLEFVPKQTDVIEYGDALSVVGEPENLQRFATFAGHRSKAIHETDLISLGVGIVAGILLGMASVDFGGKRFALGMAGGPLFVGLFLGHFGSIGRVVGHLPRASRLLLTEAGLVFFLANAGVQAGGKLAPVVAQYGLSILLMASLVTVTPILLSFLMGRYVLKMNLFEIAGGICGGMTSTPGLGVITGKTDSEIPIVSYAAAYPVALVLMTLAAQILASDLM